MEEKQYDSEQFDRIVKADLLGFTLAGPTGGLMGVCISSKKNSRDRPL